MLENARASTAETLGVRADEVTFTPSGTHAVHLGLLGLASAGSHIAATAVEHSSVLHAARWHVTHGGHFSTVSVDRLGRASRAALADLEAARPVDVLAVQQANHEVGTTQPVDELAGATNGAIFVDACAAGGRAPLPARWDALALSAHKWGGPPGVGILLVRKGATWRNPFPGDDRADERSTGFENVPAALAAAAALAETHDASRNARQFALLGELRARLDALEDIEVLGDPVDRLPHLLSLSSPYLNGEELVSELDRRGFAVDAGSACRASVLEPSHVLTAMGVLAHGNLRVSIPYDATTDVLERFVSALQDAIAMQRY